MKKQCRSNELSMSLIEFVYYEGLHIKYWADRTRVKNVIAIIILSDITSN